MSAERVEEILFEIEAGFDRAVALDQLVLMLVVFFIGAEEQLLRPDGFHEFLQLGVAGVGRVVDELV